MNDDADSPLQFPCEFPIKAMGSAGRPFERTVWAIVTRHAPDTDADSFSVTPSREGNYVSVTVTITATSRDQLDAIYADLRAERTVLAAL